MRKFNREGPVFADRHYCIPPLSRVNLDEILELIADTKYFVLHAPRQTGKTSTLLALQDRLNAEGQYRCLYVNVEAGQTAKEDTALAMQLLLGQLASRSRDILQDDFVHRVRATCMEEEGPHGVLAEVLVRWSAASPKPLVLLVVVCQIISTEMSHIPPLRNDWESGLAWATHSTLGTLKMHRRRPLSTTTGRDYLLQ